MIAAFLRGRVGGGSRTGDGGAVAVPLVGEGRALGGRGSGRGELAAGKGGGHAGGHELVPVIDKRICDAAVRVLGLDEGIAVCAGDHAQVHAGRHGELYVGIGEGFQRQAVVGKDEHLSGRGIEGGGQRGIEKDGVLP